MTLQNDETAVNRDFTRVSFGEPLGPGDSVFTITGDSSATGYGQAIINSAFASFRNITDSINAGYTNVTSLIPYQYNFGDRASAYTATDFAYFPTTNCVFVQSDGKVVVGGDNGKGYTKNIIKRFNTDGTVDAGFATTVFFGTVWDIKQQSDGKLIVVGEFGSVGPNYGSSSGSVSSPKIVRLNTDGTIDSSFVVGSGFSNNCLSCGVLSTGDIVVAGFFTSYNGSSSSYVAKLNSSGTLDTTFASNLPSIGPVKTLRVDSSDKIYIADYYNNMYRLNTNGTNDTAFNGTGFDAYVNSIRIDSNGKVVVGGYFNNYKSSGCTNVLRLNADGTKDTSFSISGGFTKNYPGFQTVNAVAVQSDNKILVGGLFTHFNTATPGSPTWVKARRIIRLNTDGTRDTSFNSGEGFDYDVNSIDIDSSGNIFCAGQFTLYNAQTCTTEFNFSNSQIAGYCCKLTSTGTMVGTPLKQSLKPVGVNLLYQNLRTTGLFYNTNVNQSYGSITNSNSIPFTHSVLSPAPGNNIEDTTYDVNLTTADTYGLKRSNYDFGPKDGAFTSSNSYFGTGSSYLTNMYPGLFALVAIDTTISQFSLVGALNDSGTGNYSSGSFSIVVKGQTYSVFYKSRYNSNSYASLIEVFIIPGLTTGITQTLYNVLSSDEQVLTGLSGRKQAYSIVFSRLDRLDTSSSLVSDIATAFLSLFEPVVVTGNSNMLAYGQSILLASGAFSAAANSSASASGSAIATFNFTLAASSSANGIGSAISNSSFTITADSSSNGIGSVIANSVFAITADSTADAIGSVIANSSFALAADSSANGIGSAIANSVFTITASSSAQATESAIATSNFTLISSSSATANSETFINSTFAAQGNSSANAESLGAINYNFSIAGNSSANAVGQALVISNFSINASSIANASSNAVANSSFAISASSSANAIGLKNIKSIFTIAGTSSANSIAKPIATSNYFISGDSVASGNSPGVPSNFAINGDSVASGNNPGVPSDFAINGDSDAIAINLYADTNFVINGDSDANGLSPGVPSNFAIIGSSDALAVGQGVFLLTADFSIIGQSQASAIGRNGNIKNSTFTLLAQSNAFAFTKKLGQTVVPYSCTKYNCYDKPVYKCVKWTYVPPSCYKSKKAIGSVSGTGAFLPAITICDQKLFEDKCIKKK